MSPHYLLTLTLAVAVSARTASTNQNTVEARSSDENVLGDLKFAYETYKDCSATDITSCLKLKLARALNRIAKSEEVSLLSGVTLIKEKDAKVDNEVEESIPRGLDESSLDNLILDKIVGFFQTHSVQVKFPSSAELREEGRQRGGRKKLAPLLAIPLLIAGFMVPLAFGALALLAGKALIVSKLALVLAGIIGLKKLLSHNGAAESHEVVVSAGHSGSGWSRSIEKAANDMAYNAYNNPPQQQ